MDPTVKKESKLNSRSLLINFSDAKLISNRSMFTQFISLELKSMESLVPYSCGYYRSSCKEPHSHRLWDAVVRNLFRGFYPRIEDDLYFISTIRLLGTHRYQITQWVRSLLIWLNVHNLSQWAHSLGPRQNQEWRTRRRPMPIPPTRNGSAMPRRRCCHPRQINRLRPPRSNKLHLHIRILTWVAAIRSHIWLNQSKLACH